MVEFLGFSRRAGRGAASEGRQPPGKPGRRWSRRRRGGHRIRSWRSN